MKSIGPTTELETPSDRAETAPAMTVLIDDDALIRALWSAEARRAGMRFRAFTTAADFLAESSRLDRRSEIYIDANLGEGVRGEKVARDIHAQGFRRIHLATGYDHAAFPEMDWIVSVVGKEPPDWRA